MVLEKSIFFSFVSFFLLFLLAVALPTFRPTIRSNVPTNNVESEKSLGRLDVQLLLDDVSWEE